jgi:anti-sigma regulatory factor (Ser/Thr protein kinase)
MSRSGVAEGLVGCVHDGGLYSSLDEFLAMAVPFVEQGVEAGEPVITGYDEAKSALLRSSLDHPEGVTFLVDSTAYATPVGAIEAYRAMFEDHVGHGATQVRVAGDTPPFGHAVFAGWDRFESAVNEVWGELPVFALCLYDLNRTPADILDVVHRTHRHLLDGDGRRRPSPRYQTVDEFEPLPVEPDPAEATTPADELRNPAPASARRAVKQVAHELLSPLDIDNLMLGLTEAVTNAHVHGEAPTIVRIWTTTDRVVVTVHDRGPGPADAMAGLRRARAELGAGGLGLWLTHQVCPDTSLIRAEDGFTVRLRMPASNG